MGQRTESAEFLTSTEAAGMLGLSRRTIQHKGQLWETCAKEAGDYLLPSSPNNGLRRARVCSRCYRYDSRDIAEYVENATRELLGDELETWRSEGKKYV